LRESRKAGLPKDPVPAAYEEVKNMNGRLNELLKSKLISGGRISVSVLLLIALWWLLSAILKDSVFPSPWLTLNTMIEDIASGKMLPALGITLLRVLKAFLLTLATGTAAGCILGLSKNAKNLFGYWMVIGTSIPPLVIIIVVFLGSGLSENAAMAAIVLTTVFTIAQNIEEGVKAINHSLIDMGKTLQAPGRLMLSKIILPQIYPYIMASARFGLSLTWKMAIFVEQIGRSDGIGYSINHYYQLYKMEHVLSYALIFILVMLLIEFTLNNLIEPRLFRWRPKRA
jgi:NitT/TauT family transport system permease protein